MIDGRIGANGAEVRQTKDGKPYVKFSIANNSNPKQETPEWFDVICYDSNVINNLTEYLTKGTHVMIIGTFKASVNVDRNGKVWLNQTVTAYSIQFIGTKDREKDKDNNASTTVAEGAMSTYTGNTASSMTIPKPTVVEVVPEVTIPVPEPSVVTVGAVSANGLDMDDDLPF